LEEMEMVRKKEKDEADKKENEPYFKTFFKTFKFLYRIKNLDEEEEDTDENYNVSVYQILPYPPNTKDVKDSFIQRT
jgi:hypothetical protein